MGLLGPLEAASRQCQSVPGERRILLSLRNVLSVNVANADKDAAFMLVDARDDHAEARRKRVHSVRPRNAGRDTLQGEANTKKKTSP